LHDSLNNLLIQYDFQEQCGHNRNKLSYGQATQLDVRALALALLRNRIPFLVITLLNLIVTRV